MADMKYHVVKADDSTMQIHWGSARPDKLPKDEEEARQRAYKERWIPAGWTLVASFDEEEAAEAKLKEELAKLPEAKKDTK